MSTFEPEKPMMFCLLVPEFLEDQEAPEVLKVHDSCKLFRDKFD
jgi:hypothetical protein